ncbi:MAG: DUF4412 domain-containing protein [Verrucomicrobiota bacterium]|nr:DUF4412 domain-containing protein [Verrucomicrobiota bacterium]
MKNLITLLFLFVLTLGMNAQTPPFNIPKAFSVDQKTTISGQPEDFTTKMYTDDGKVRVEISPRGMKMITIVRPDQKKIYNIMVDQKMYMEMPMDPKKDPLKALPDINSKIEKVGEETVNGIACDKYKFTNGGVEVFGYVSKETQFIVRIQSADGKMTSDWTNFIEGPQPAGLFVPPAGFIKMTMPAGMKIPGVPSK